MNVRAGLLKRARVLAALCGLGLLLPPLSMWLKALEPHIGAVPFWLIDLGAHWQLLYLFGLIVSLVTVCIASRDARWLLGCALCGLPWLTATPSLDRAAMTGKDVLIVATANVYLENANSEPLAKWLRERQVDVVVVIEVSERYGRQLAQLKEYPFHKIMPRDSPFGIAVLSRHPFESVAERATEDSIPYIRAVIDWKGRKVALTALHPMPPISPVFALRRDQLLHVETQDLQRRATPSLVAGDLNATVWSTAFREPASLGFKTASPPRPTWPSVFKGLMGIPIDHILASTDWRLVSSEVGPNIGSDHLPVVAKLQLEE